MWIVPVTSCSLQRPPRGVPGQGSRQGLDACTARMQTESLRPSIAAASPARGARARVPPGFRRVHSAHANCRVRRERWVFPLTCAHNAPAHIHTHAATRYSTYTHRGAASLAGT